MITCPLLINGQEILLQSFRSRSPFYPQYTYQVANANLLDVSSAIGGVRKARLDELPTRLAALKNAARLFTCPAEYLEHAVRMTGTPVSIIREVIREIPQMLLQTADLLHLRFGANQTQPDVFQEPELPGLQRYLIPAEGYAYAVTPGNDPRAAALVAGTLAALGIPFILRPSIRDAIAPLVLKALIEAGFDPHACQLIYSDRCDPEHDQKHFKLLEKCRAVWTFGTAAQVDTSLRFRPQTTVELDLEEMGIQVSTDHQLHQDLSGLPTEAIAKHLSIQTRLQDGFEGKTVLRHDSGNCAAIWLADDFTPSTGEKLFQSIAFPSVCTATKSIMLVEAGQSQAGENWLQRVVEYLAGLKIGDPLDPQTQVGWIDQRNLDRLEALRQANALRLRSFGGVRHGPFQASPLVVTSQETVRDFFAQEIPAYVLALRCCNSLADAVQQVNHYTTELLRLGVSFYGFPIDQVQECLLAVRAHSLFFEKPAGLLPPLFHEGNDYAQRLTNGRVLIY